MATDDTFKVYIYDNTTGKENIKVAKLDFLHSSADNSESIERAHSLVADLEDSTVERQFFLNLLVEAYAKGICGKPGLIINHDFFSHVLNRSPIIIVITTEKMVKPLPPPRSRGPPIAAQPVFLKTFARSFILAQPKEDSGDGSISFYVDLICAKKRFDAGVLPPDDSRYAGKTLMQVATAYAISEGYEDISLSAVPELLLFYPKWGFEFRPSCHESALEIPEQLRRRPFVDTRLEDEETKVHPIYVEDNKPFLDFMLALREAGLEHEHPPVPKKGDSTADGIKKDAACKMALTTEELKEWGCEEDGYKMRKCNIQKQRRK